MVSHGYTYKRAMKGLALCHEVQPGDPGALALAAYTSAARALPVGPTTICEVMVPVSTSYISTPKEKMSACTAGSYKSGHVSCFLDTWKPR